MTGPPKGGAALGIVLMVITTAGWAGAWITARATAHEADPLWVAVGRSVVASVCLLPVWWVWGRSRAQLDAQARRVLVGMALTGAIGYNLFFLWGIQWAPASDGAIITPGLAGLASVGVAWAWTRKPPEPRALLGGGLALLGCSIVGWGAFAGGVDATRIAGIACFAASSLVWGIYTNLGRKISDRVPAVTGVLASSALGAILLAPVAWIAAGGVPVASWSGAVWANVGYLGAVATAVAFVTYYAGVQRLGIDRAAPWLGMVPVWGVTGAGLFLGEAVTWWHVGGGAVVLAGIVAPTLKPKR